MLAVHNLSAQESKLSIFEPHPPVSLHSLLRIQLDESILIASSLRNLPSSPRGRDLIRAEEQLIDRLRIQVFGLAVANIDSDMRQHVRLMEAAHASE